MTTAAQLIVDARVSAGLSQAELARRAGITRSVMNVYERGHREPGADALVRILASAGQRLVVEPVPAAPVDVERAGSILEQVLGLAEVLPFRPGAVNTYPPLAASVG
ncbi:MAG: helix-turn-helix domain-containing protein [Solirubrobacterales bacterium]